MQTGGADESNFWDFQAQDELFRQANNVPGDHSHGAQTVQLGDNSHKSLGMHTIPEYPGHESSK